MAIIFDTQEDFEYAVMDVLKERLRVEVITYGNKFVEEVKIAVLDHGLYEIICQDRDTV